MTLNDFYKIFESKSDILNKTINNVIWKLQFMLSIEFITRRLNLRASATEHQSVHYMAEKLCETRSFLAARMERS